MGKWNGEGGGVWADGFERWVVGLERFDVFKAERSWDFLLEREVDL